MLDPTSNRLRVDSHQTAESFTYQHTLFRAESGTCLVLQQALIEIDEFQPRVSPDCISINFRTRAAFQQL